MVKENSGRPFVDVSESVGRWSSSEHELFLQGLQKYGKDWKAIANEVSIEWRFADEW